MADDYILTNEKWMYSISKYLTIRVKNNKKICGE